MTCTNCKSERLAHVDAKCSDMCHFSVKGQERDNYVPYTVGIGGGDYVAFIYCLDCGMIQPRDDFAFPVSQEALDEVFDR